MVSPIHEHNRFYLQEDRRVRVKEYFKFLLAEATAARSFQQPTVLDVGCATGDFLSYLHSEWPEARLAGMDSSEEFVDRAREALPQARFFVGDIYSGAGLPREAFDVVFMSGVNLYFREVEPWIKNLLALARETVYVFGIFNPEKLDVRATIERPGESSSSTPWNLISQESIRLILDRLGVRHTFREWELPIENPRVHEDPIRSWTVETRDGHYLVINGTQIVHRFALLTMHPATGPKSSF